MPIFGSAYRESAADLRRVPSGRVADHYVTSFDRLWDDPGEAHYSCKFGDSRVRREMTDGAP